MVKKMHDADIIIIYILLSHGFTSGGYQLNIFPTNKRIAEKFIEFIYEYGLDAKEGISEKSVSLVKNKLKNMGLISYYINHDIHRRVMRIDLKELAKHQEYMEERMLYWTRSQNKILAAGIKESCPEYNSDKTFKTTLYTEYEKNIIH